MTRIIPHCMQELNHVEKMCQKEIKLISLEFSSHGGFYFSPLFRCHDFFPKVGNAHLQLQPAVEVIATVPLGPTLTPGKLTNDSAKKSRTRWDSPHKMLAWHFSRSNKNAVRCQATPKVTTITNKKHCKRTPSTQVQNLHAGSAKKI